MTASVELDKYLLAFGQRLKHVCLARGGAVLAAVVLTVAIGGAYYAIETGFDAAVVMTARLLLVGGIAAILYLLIIKPIQQLPQQTAVVMERRGPAFAGRVLTYQQIQDPANPFRELLAEDTLKISADYPLDRLVQRQEIALPGVVAVVCCVILLGLIAAGPGLLNYSLRHLLAGWAFNGLLPPQSITVTPGDDLVRRGGNVRVQAVMSGYEPEQAQVYVRIGDKDWQTVEMVQRPEGFEFTFFSVREPLQYYVASMGIRSPAYTVQVVEVPAISNLKLTYHYPEWTRRAPETIEHGGDISTVADTAIDLEVVTDQPLPDGLLVLNSDGQPLTSDGTTARTSFAITEDGQYFIAAQLGDEQVRLSDDYFIKVVEDGKPEIRFARPGRDWNASNIEEVTARVEVKDDYALETLGLRYSINGGDWQTVPLTTTGDADTVDHVFFLEDIRSNEQSLQPGDLIAYYAEAKDRLNSSQTDMYFIEVQPFDRRYTQSQQMGGGGGGQNNPQQEISQRQKEIIVSTWNLLREQTGQQAEDAALTIKDNATLLSELQQTLAGQAKTLADRTRARELTSVDERINTFVENLEQAVTAMQPAAERLAETDLQAAIQPEQTALQHLLRAESVFNDIQVSLQRGQGGGGGGSQASRDLAEMFELEMDLEKNQYETGSSAARQEPAEAADDAMRKLEELARRQEQLANDFQRQQQLTEAQRWQQEMLRRDAEQLQRQLENRQQQQAGNQQGQGQSGQSGSSSDSADSELSRRLGSAIRAMNEAAEEMRGNNNSERLQQAVQEAQRQLQQARNQVAEDQQQSMQQQFQNMAESAADLHRQQARVEDKLQDAMREALAQRRQDEDTITSPLSYEEEMELAEQKRALLEELQSLRQSMKNAASNYQAQEPEAARKLEQANEELRDAKIDTRLDIAASYIEQGASLYITSSESVVTNALRNLENSLAQAQAMVSGSEQPGENDLDRALAQTRALRRELQQLTSGNPDQSNQNDAESGQATEGSDSQAGQNNNAGGRIGGNWYGGWDGWTRPNGIIRPEYRERLNDDINAAANSVNPIIPELRDQGLTDAEIDEIYRILRDLTYAPMDDQKNNLILQQELTKRLALLEQLELRLQQGLSKQQAGAIRSTVSET
ncbi:MAG: hypothetical protein HW386_1551, partial [Gammaproteobacteria bacterium]|nr:hypothetical protein [Gammaproteobacteria bacterium]